MKTISAFKARTNFGEVMNEVYYKGTEIVVERKGKPMVKIVKMKPSELGETASFLKAAGAWKDLDTDKMIKRIYKNRKDGSSKRRYLANWGK
ncbi:MAG: Prevent-host-death family protein [Candidatus Gottesmanbacteria bacterium GW2011_GWA1_43_11]|uniref:Antitoxin n=1 Tax=Candidatus Gottesmanbacteria bacterium GW2011_GWA1_43_11 TaxID=1618436 RepID=A0A0G1EPK9_9BACT|nr:MAG: Prevent-host-death family protein [Candidatus Gottesmanbacteria bacterium GW2011_GWA1_43_11]